MGQQERAVQVEEGSPNFQDVLKRRLNRRQVLKVGLVMSAATVARPVLRTSVFARDGREALFTPIQPNTLDEIVVPEGFRADVLIRWGDPLFPGISPFDISSQSGSLQAQRLGFNCDFLAFLPLPPGSENANRGLLWVNHEYSDGSMMFPGYDASNPTREQVEVELAAHGASVVAVERRGGRWSYRQDHHRNRRITATTPMRISGPAAGHPWLRTSADPTGTSVLGTLANCGGGITPWGTVLTCEENFNQLFANQAATDPALAAAHARYGIPAGASSRKWERFVDRFDLAKEPHEPFRFGWVVEVDPYRPDSTPVKRTAIGRFKHEGAATALSRSGRAVVYSGDDESFEHVYKFVSERTYDPDDRRRNLRLLDSGTLYAARFNDDGSGEWLPLAFGRGPLVPPAFVSQADVLIRARDAARALGATRMDRPEDVETNSVSGRVYVVLTNNAKRGVGTDPGPDAANPRANNRFGHVIEITEHAGNSVVATTFRWEIFLLCGNPSDPSTYFAGFDKSKVSPISNPDNITFDRRGSMWIATDGQPGALGANDAIHSVPTAGPSRGHVKQFLSAVPGAEVASLIFNPDRHALFASIQHPGEGGALARPKSVWPDGPSGPARPSVIVVSRQNGGSITG